MNIGYARVSTLDQNLDLQMQALRKGCKTIFREKLGPVLPSRAYIG
jgi:DNA invertase Pin-like site-specific DNA recombinase